MGVGACGEYIAGEAGDAGELAPCRIPESGPGCALCDAYAAAAADAATGSLPLASWL